MLFLVFRIHNQLILFSLFYIDDAQLSQSHELNAEIENIDIENQFDSDDDHYPEFDIGRWVGKSNKMTTAQKIDVLKKCWKPPVSYNFHKDSDDKKRKFLHNWLETYEPWLVYSEKSKGAFCLHCALFPPIVVRGVLGAFIKTPFNRYKDMNYACKSHASSQWHRNSTLAAKKFLEDVPVDVQMVTGHQQMIEQNRKMLSSIISSIIFCGTHDLALRGKELDAGKFFINFQIYSSLIIK